VQPAAAARVQILSVRTLPPARAAQTLEARLRLPRLPPCFPLELSLWPGTDQGSVRCFAFHPSAARRRCAPTFPSSKAAAPISEPRAPPAELRSAAQLRAAAKLSSVADLHSAAKLRSVA
jgi:hypothetical protein